MSDQSQHSPSRLVESHARSGSGGAKHVSASPSRGHWEPYHSLDPSLDPDKESHNGPATPPSDASSPRDNEPLCRSRSREFASPRPQRYNIQWLHHHGPSLPPFPTHQSSDEEMWEFTAPCGAKSWVLLKRGLLTWDAFLESPMTAYELPVLDAEGRIISEGVYRSFKISCLQSFARGDAGHKACLDPIAFAPVDAGDELRDTTGNTKARIVPSEEMGSSQDFCSISAEQRAGERASLNENVRRMRSHQYWYGNSTARSAEKIMNACRSSCKAVRTFHESFRRMRSLIQDAKLATHVLPQVEGKLKEMEDLVAQVLDTMDHTTKNPNDWEKATARGVHDLVSSLHAVAGFAQMEDTARQQTLGGWVNYAQRKEREAKHWGSLYEALSKNSENPTEAGASGQQQSETSHKG
ncbi:hypothetical protein DB88DRAFT_470631 [Papiliotrema laurentii]|uniref:Uncharacterized protein n=1 Tax=Papiliotrema laurentii TaxID=5418 RepID=A0AAD9FTH5_PAPLA|nr:hypothetical protein DB88DRAFT_470631 [Papiliotrema laurentii]